MFDGVNGRSGDTADGREDPEERGRGEKKEGERELGRKSGHKRTGKKRSERKQTEAFGQNQEDGFEDFKFLT